MAEFPFPSYYNKRLTEKHTAINNPYHPDKGRNFLSIYGVNKTISDLKNFN